MTIHVLTASGAIAGLVALQNVVDGNIRAGLIWLIVYQVLDGVDGPRFVTNLRDEPASVRIGARVRAEFVERDGRRHVVFGAEA